MLRSSVAMCVFALSCPQAVEAGADFSDDFVGLLHMQTSSMPRHVLAAEVWQKVTLVQHVPSINQVRVAFDQEGLLHVAVAEEHLTLDFLDVPPDRVERHQSPEKTLGLPRGPTWDYRRVFVRDAETAGCADVQWNSANALQRRCFLSASNRAWWLVSPPVSGGPGSYGFALALPVKDGAKVQVLVLNGFEHCGAKLETARNEVAACSLPTSTEVLAEFVFDTPSFGTPSFGLTQTRAAVGRTSASTCDFADMSGSWDLNRTAWQPLTGCAIEIGAAPPPVRPLCFIGDSHFEHSNIGMRAYERGGNVLGLGTVSLLACRPNTTDPLCQNAGTRNYQSWLNEPSFAPGIAQCALNVGTDGIVVASIGSHYPEGSPAKVSNMVKDLLSTVPPGACVLITNTLDVHHETIPSKFGSFQQFVRNPWNIEAANRGVREGLDLAKRDRTHYVDVSSSSQALNVDGHKPSDPVHFGAEFYGHMTDLIFTAMQTLCI